MNNLKNFTSINCICCGSKIELYDAIGNPHFDMNKFMDQYQPYDRYRPESQIWKNGIIELLSAGYGSNNDGNMYYIGICDECVDINTINGRLRYSGCYLGSDVYSKEELSKFEERRNRENNINSLLDDELKTKLKIVKEKWIDLIADDYSTYPDEGVEVLVSNGYNHDVAYFIMSGIYKWVKITVKDNGVSDFDNFIPTKWRYI